MLSGVAYVDTGNTGRRASARCGPLPVCRNSLQENNRCGCHEGNPGHWEQISFLISSAYGNYASDEGESIAREAYGPNYDRLAALKTKYDPTNFFRMNHNITPTEVDRTKTADVGAVQAEML